MKKRYIFLILSVLYISIILVIRLPKAMDDAVNKAVDQNKEFIHGYNVCDLELENKKYEVASDCFGELLKKYDRSDVRFSYAFSLAQSKKYDLAKKELNYIIENEKLQVELVEKSKKLNTQIDEILAILNEN